MIICSGFYPFEEQPKHAESIKVSPDKVVLAEDRGAFEKISLFEGNVLMQ